MNSTAPGAAPRPINFRSIEPVAPDGPAGNLRWGVRVNRYLYFLPDTSPPFSFDEDLNYPIQISIPARAPLNRLAVLFRIFLVIPAAIVGSVVGAGLGLIDRKS